MNKLINYTFLLIMLVLASCSGYNIDNKLVNYAYRYNPGSRLLRPDLRLYHLDDSTSAVFVRISKRELTMQQEGDSGLMGQLRITSKVYDRQAGDSLVDSVDHSYMIEADGQGLFVLSFPVKVPKGRKLMIKSYIYDVNRQRGDFYYLNANKQEVDGTQDFMFFRTADMMPYFRSYFRPEDSLWAYYRDNRAEQLHVRHYPPSIEPVAYPPYLGMKAMDPPESDTAWTYLQTDTTCLNLAIEGSYILCREENAEKGAYLQYFSPSYPYVEWPAQMIGPLQYLCTGEEYSEITMMDDPKIAVDNFWLKQTGNITASRELIRIYYNRVQLANIFFPSYRPGWETDRGMIFIIFGAPDRVYRTNNSERWYYGSGDEASAVYFTFAGVEHPLTDNHYVLFRSSYYKSIWLDAIRSWRQGKAFSFVNYEGTKR